MRLRNRKTTYFPTSASLKMHLGGEVAVGLEIKTAYKEQEHDYC
jgi:hypothetical protein